ncbi:calcium-binding and coiled-coil domain-containing protein 2 [Pseudophryne corroboree]|uniref:calcium-binding and coiled-coil domain-containing protein 2 n=1 Tax=Pseudophryne corroboree TaxID=495146 RepID=UPI003081727D
MDEEDGPPTSLIPPEQRHFSQVIFIDVQKIYAPDTDVKCRYRTRENFIPGKKDWIGLFKVCWKTTGDHCTWIYASSSLEDTVLFKAYYLPKDDEFYQFCYVDQNGEVRGASVPFQFRSNITEEEDDILMVTTELEMMKTKEECIILKETVQNLTEEKSALQDTISLLQCNNRTQADKIQTLEAEINKQHKENVENQMKELEEEKAKMNKIIQSLELDVQKLRSKEEKLSKELTDTETLKTTNIELMECSQKLQNQVKLLEEERKKLESELSQYIDKDQKLCSERREMEILLEKPVDEKNNLRSELAAKQEALEIMTATFNLCKEEIIKLRADHEMQEWTLETEKKQNKKIQHLLAEERKRCQDLAFSMKEKSAKLTCANESISNLQDQLAVLQVQIKKLENEMKHREKFQESREKQVHLGTLQNEKKQNEKLQESLVKQNKAAKDAERKMWEQLKSTEEELSIMEQKMSQQQAQIATLESEKKQNEKLQESLVKQNKTAVDAERELREQLKSIVEKMSNLEQKLSQQQNENRRQREANDILRSTVDMQESEIQELKESERKHQIERDELHCQLLQIDMFNPHSQTSGLLYGNPYERANTSSSTETEGIQQRNPLICPICSEQFQANECQVYEDHVMCH